MAKTNWQDPKTSEMRSTHIAGLMEAVGKVEDSIGMESVYETNVPLTEVFISSDDRYRIFQAPEGKRNWTAEQPPVIKRNGSVISSGFEIDYGGGAIVLNVNDTVARTYTADVTYIKQTEISSIKTQRFVVGTSTSGWTAADCDYLCDGTNDQEEIIQALNDLPATGGEVVILDGTYSINASIIIPYDNVTIRGNGSATILKRMYNNSSATEGSTAGGVIYVNERDGCKIQDLQIDGNGNIQNHSNNISIRLRYTNNSAITNVISYNNNRGASISVTYSSNSIIASNICYSDTQNASGGIFIGYSSNIIVGNNIVHGLPGNGITLYYADYTLVTGNISNNNDSGIRLSGYSNYNTITGNTCIRGTGLATDYTENQYTINLVTSSNNYNLITNNSCMGKAVTSAGGTGNTLINNKFDAT